MRLKMILMLYMLACVPLRAEDKVDTFAQKRTQRESAVRALPAGTFSGRMSRLTDGVRQWRSAPKSRAAASRLSTAVPAEQRSAWIELNRASAGELSVHWDEKNRLPIYFSARDLLPAADKNRDVEQLSLDFISKSRALFGMSDPEARFEPLRVLRDELGMTHVRMQQAYANLPVYGRDLYLHYNRQKQLQSVNGRTLPITASIDVKPALTAAEAEAIALKALDLTDSGAVQPSSALLIYPDEADMLHLAYRVNVVPSLLQNWEVFIDAHSGELLHKANRVCSDGPVTGSGVDLYGQTQNFNAYQIGTEYYMIDTSKPMFDAAGSKFPNEVKGGIVLLDARNGEGKEIFFVTSTDPNNWGASNAISALFYGNIVYDYFSAVHNRNSIDGSGGTMYMVVNLGQNLNNAFWTGKMMVFGNGDNNFLTDLAGALDVTGHEMSHGVITHSANLIYENESGALNESFADVFGVCVEFYHEGENADWLVGEDVITPTRAGDGLRDVEAPDGPNVSGSKQPANMSQFQRLPNTPEGDNGGVHINSGIPNRAFYLIASNIGIPKAEKIYYRALTTYLTRSSQFIDARLALSRAAADLHGEGSAEQTAVESAFDQVGITGNQGTPPPPVEPPVQGQSWVLAVDSQTRGLYRVSPDLSTIELISAGPVLNKPSVTDDGTAIVYVDTNYNPHLVSIDGSDEILLDDSGVFWNLSVSPDGTKLAATSVETDGRIYVLDLLTDQLIEHTLYAQTFGEGERAPLVLYADAMDWTLDSEVIVYDALNVAFSASGDTIGYFDINYLNAANGNIIRAFPPQPQGINIGNPVLASNNDFVMAFDYVDETGAFKVLGANLETGDVAQIADNGFSPGRPDFSPDDRAVIYEYTDGEQYGVFAVSLLADGISGAGDDQQFLTGAMYPIWLSVGFRADAEDRQLADAGQPVSFELEQNYPNPFNPVTRIRFTLEGASEVQLAVFDLLGREVARLLDQPLSSGQHSVTFEARDLPSGVYLYKLRAGNQVRTRKMLLVK